jgi:hypothetical protein
VRYQKVIKVAIYHSLQYNVDALFIATNAPGRSAFNTLEIKMAPVSNKFTGLTLPEDHFGNHLNLRGITIHANLEKSRRCNLENVKNFCSRKKDPIFIEFCPASGGKEVGSKTVGTPHCYQYQQLTLQHGLKMDENSLHSTFQESLAVGLNF